MYYNLVHILKIEPNITMRESNKHYGQFKSSIIMTIINNRYNLRRNTSLIIIKLLTIFTVCEKKPACENNGL